MDPTFAPHGSQSDDARFVLPHDPYRALYLHVPFCTSRCAYCDFATQALPASDPAVDTYVEALALSVRRAGRAGELGAVETVYVGGGTPSHAGLSRLSLLLYTLSTSMHLTPEVECTMEANPESLTGRMVADVWALGVNRLSIGVQSFDDAVLRTLGRAHDADAALRAIEAAKERFDNVSVDLMAGVPGQSLASFTSSVARAIAAGVTHVSIYPLVIEENTPFGHALERGELQEPDEDEQAEAMEEAARLLAHAGFSRYEVASYAQPGFACRHNRAYWSGVPYLGLGRSATTMAQTAEGRVRITDGVVTDRLDRRGMLIEDLMLAMRRTEGASDGDVAQAALEVPGMEACLADLARLGLVEHACGRWRPSERGWLCGNELYGRILDLDLDASF